MSYSIFYERQFIKIDEHRVIPFVLCGDNNLFYSGSNNKRVRDWCNIRSFGDIIVNNEAVEEQCMQLRADVIKRNEENKKQYGSWDDYKDELFGCFVGVSMRGNSTRNTTFNMYKSFFVGAVKTAMTVEELREQGFNIFVTSGCMGEDFRKEGLKPFTFVPNTSKELEEFIIEQSKKIEGKGLSFWVESTISERSFKQFKKQFKKQPRVKKEKVIDKYFVINCTNSHGYFFKHKRHGYKYAFDINGARIFLTEKQAEKSVKKLEAKFGEGLFPIEKVEKKIAVLV